MTICYKLDQLSAHTIMF